MGKKQYKTGQKNIRFIEVPKSLYDIKIAKLNRIENVDYIFPLKTVFKLIDIRI